MSLEAFLNIVACILLILFGVYAIVQPYAAAELAHIKPDNATARAEIRTAFGGPSLAMGAGALILNQAAAYQVIGLVWLGIFVIRLISTYLDRPPLERTYILSGVFELVIGLILFL